MARVRLTLCAALQMAALAHAIQANISKTTTPRVDDVIPNISDVVNTTTIPIVRNNSLLLLHVVFMVLAWLVCGSIGIVLVRHGRYHVTDALFLKRPVWFHGHWMCMLGALLFTVGGFVAVFAYRGGFTSLPEMGAAIARAHPPLGLVIFVLTLVNPVVALCRPAPDAASRQVVDWMHWLIGQSVYCMAILNILLGLNITTAKEFAPRWLLPFTGAFVVFHITTEVILQAHRYYLDSLSTKDETKGLMLMSSKPVTSNPFDDDDDDGPPAPSSSSTAVPLPLNRASVFRKYFILVYMIVTAGVGFIFILTVTTSLL